MPLSWKSVLTSGVLCLAASGAIVHAQESKTQMPAGKPAEKAPAAAALPTPATPLKPGTIGYTITMEMQGQKLDLETSSEISDGKEVWIIKDTTKTPQGDVVETVTLDKKTLAVLSRTVQRGPVSISLTFKDNKAAGAMEMGGQSRTVDADLGGALFADGAGAYQVMATLPLKEGYTTTFRNFNIRQNKTDMKQLKVVGSENVTVPAGSFDSFKLEVSNADGSGTPTTVWIAKTTRQPVKTQTTAPNGAVVTAELRK